MKIPEFVQWFNGHISPGIDELTLEKMNKYAAKNPRVMGEYYNADFIKVSDWMKDVSI